MTVNVQNIKDEFLNFLRDNLNSYDDNSRVTTKTKTITATAGQTVFSLGTTMSFVRSVTVDGTAQTFGTEYSINWRGTNRGSVELASALSGGETVVIVWGAKNSSGNFVYPDFPRADLGISTYPRVGFKLRSSIEPAGLGGGLDMPYKHTFVISVKVMYHGNASIDEMIQALRVVIAQHCKNFYNFRFISPTDIGEYSLTEDASQNILSKIIDFNIPDEFENIAYA